MLISYTFRPPAKQIERATKSLLAKMNEDMEDVDDEDDSMDEDSDSDAGSAESDASD